MNKSATRKHAAPSTTGKVYFIRIELRDTTPLVWRRIAVPATYSFWDLHVAIQDVMGWLDYHLHEFSIPQLDRRVAIGIPDDETDDEQRAGWNEQIADHFSNIWSFTYLYDFGDQWVHDVSVEALHDSDGGVYPRCIDGANAAPPEDCAGTGGFEELKEVLAGPKDARYREMRDWLKNKHAKCYWPFDPAAFNARAVRFDNPSERFQIAFAGG